MNKLSLALFAGLLALSAGPALAQRGAGSDDCILDNCRDRRPSGSQPQGNTPSDNRRDRDYDREPRRDRYGDNRPSRGNRFDDNRPYGRDRFGDGARGGGGGERYGARPGEFDFYVLALSWSPSFCNSQAGRRSREQCAIAASSAFVVHGLWPQFERGFPSYCRDQSPRFALDQARGVFRKRGWRATNGASTAPARACRRPNISPPPARRATWSKFRRTIHRRRPAPASIRWTSSAPSWRPTARCGRACWR